jgi:hypothetical protein
MQRVIVTVKRRGEARVRDLEVPAEVGAERLSKIVAEALRWESDPAGQPVEYAIMAEPPGRLLTSQESLAQAGAWDGAWLVFQPLGEEVPPPVHPPRPDVPPAPPGGPVVGWGDWDFDLPIEQGTESDETSSEAGGFVWKQLD